MQLLTSVSVANFLLRTMGVRGMDFLNFARTYTSVQETDSIDEALVQGINFIYIVLKCLLRQISFFARLNSLFYAKIVSLST